MQYTQSPTTSNSCSTNYLELLKLEPPPFSFRRALHRVFDTLSKCLACCLMLLTPVFLGLAIAGHWNPHVWLGAVSLGFNIAFLATGIIIGETIVFFTRPPNPYVQLLREMKKTLESQSR